MWYAPCRIYILFWKYLYTNMQDELGVLAILPAHQMLLFRSLDFKECYKQALLPSATPLANF